MNLSELNQQQFVDKFGGVYEHSPWVAKQTYPLLSSSIKTADDLAALMTKTMLNANKQAQLELICAHPDLAGKAAIAGDLTDESTNEQKGAGLDQCSKAEFAEFTRLNNAYTEKFNFPFIIAVKGHNRSSILAAFAARLNNSTQDEFFEALKQINRIAKFRIKEIYK
ncbi:MAG: 2-oxo-4-hydroxy-4-carboxy-5-ureidoimidazoline decarboxylase [Robiginitomaculum sp.]|nr:2-oxo-4-hydroxy-4-carboxy-5-ureidoimidazoline decarboxylase [Robiginitomaculum sp.]